MLIKRITQIKTFHWHFRSPVAVVETPVAACRRLVVKPASGSKPPRRPYRRIKGVADKEVTTALYKEVVSIGVLT